MANSTKVVLLIVLFPLVMVLDAFAVQQFWHWFIVPFGIVEISLGHALGLNLFAGFVKTGASYSERRSSDEYLAALLGYCVAVFIILGIASLVAMHLM